MGHNPGSSLPFMYDLREIQSPDMARRASPQDARFIDPVPIIELPPFSGRNERFGPTHLDLCCYVDMFRLPINSDAAGAANSWTYYTYEGSGADRSAVLRHTSFPPRFPYQFTVGRHIVTEAETALLSGEKCVSSYILPDRRLVFIFTRLSVSQPGEFMLRYRVFNRNSVEGSILGECVGAKFRIYTTNDFPGYPATTELTNSLAMLHYPGLRSRR